MTLNREINWLTDRLLEHYPHLRAKTDQNFPDIQEGTARLWLTTRIIWGIPKGFTYWWTDHMGILGGIIIRPLTDQILERIRTDYWDSIWDFDPAGDICWVDYAYGPGLYPKIFALCQSTGCTRVGWEHRERIHIRPFARVPAKTMKMAFHL